ncbi:MAG: AbrB/MazE/SpoVT family DNA-binding domain-containing protein [Candidatus Methanoperedens sp.]|nr:hypothetical protein [Candidatus Methanoperedens sp.]MCZ7395294.1 hypothetical protein [Candidatus Methanoperedens sp.]
MKNLEEITMVKRTIRKFNYSQIITLPKQLTESLNLGVGSVVNVTLNEEKNKLMIEGEKRG